MLPDLTADVPIQQPDVLLDMAILKQIDEILDSKPVPPATNRNSEDKTYEPSNKADNFFKKIVDLPEMPWKLICIAAPEFKPMPPANLSSFQPKKASS